MHGVASTFSRTIAAAAESTFLVQGGDKERERERGERKGAKHDSALEEQAASEAQRQGWMRGKRKRDKRVAWG